LPREKRITGKKKGKVFYGKSSPSTNSTDRGREWPHILSKDQEGGERGKEKAICMEMVWKSCGIHLSRRKSSLDVYPFA